MKTTYLSTLLFIFIIPLTTLSNGDSPKVKQNRVNQNQSYTVKYTYDALGRLTQAVYNDEHSIRYEYDANGNILSVVSGPYDPTTVEGGEQGPYTYKLFQNYPNPFNPASTIAYEVKEHTLVKLVLYDILGRRVAVLVNEMQDAGHYTRTFDARNYPSGVYFYRIEMGNFIAVKKMVLVK